MTVKWIHYLVIGLEIERKTAPPFEQWEGEIRVTETMRFSAPWHRGDLYLKGEEWYGEDRATSVFDPMLHDVKTWQNNASVCRRIQLSRRREELSYSHHAEVSPLEPAQQDTYLQLAVDNLLSVRQLREKIRADLGDDDVRFRTRPFDERAQDLADKGERLAEEISRKLPVAGEDAAAVLTEGVEKFREAARLLAEARSSERMAA